ncbi:polyphosphate kinase 1 [Peptostreptococcus equinus]|uniref:Polyphosphate kinase n=1 Tax=Peptostreptococcus equinus TaxID=3003601 RepID=A0ABY7JUV2_9FIRM|nr:polyphosphate kinase 1 [Peptostreptococcus sp. CBA3647]WAW15765.1 polyphosphate kinase 1 [Peptostreptococcus sp. CBA3647]
MQVKENSLYMQNREISWLRFNERVLSEADQADVATYEKFKFVSIFTSNLDEFFMVRVGSLHDMSYMKKIALDSKTGMTPKEQISAILKMLPDMYNRKDTLYDKIVEEQKEYNIFDLKYIDLSKNQEKYINSYYEENIKPILSPQIVDIRHPFPFLNNLILYVYIELQKDGKTFFGLVEIPNSAPDFILLPGEAIDYILIEEIVYNKVEEIFNDFEIINKSVICVTRNFDLDADSELADEFDDYKDKMKMILKKRKRQAVVRLESNQRLNDNMKKFLLSKLELNEQAYFYTTSPMKMKFVFDLLSVIPSAKKEKILYPEFTPYYYNNEKKTLLIDAIEKKDMLLSYPYDDMQTFIDLLSEAADDDRVVSIKITIYRLAKNSKIAKNLIRAAENGKNVTVLLELKARFDEENNIDYSNLLYQSGCKILYGFEKYKVHSKLCQITYRGRRGEYKYITQIGTGNYNESTSKIYSDFSLITANREIGLDATDFFNYMSVGNLNGKYEYLVQSPSSLKDKFLKLIDREIQKGSDGYLFFKMNSFTDKDFIKKLSEASQNNVQVILIIRGICCLLPGVEGKTENVEVRSIVGRFLEHARVFQFGRGEQADLYIGSADLMTRNTEQRVEIACPIFDLDIKKRIEDYIKQQLNDGVKGRKMNSKGEYELVTNIHNSVASQDYFMSLANRKRMSQADNIINKKETNNLFRKLFRK